MSKRRGVYSADSKEKQKATKIFDGMIRELLIHLTFFLNVYSVCHNCVFTSPLTNRTLGSG
jgi:hypothetical protein